MIIFKFYKPHCKDVFFVAANILENTLIELIR